MSTENATCESADYASTKQPYCRPAIEPRRVKFDFQDIDTPFYYKENSLISALWAALSASFPVGEAEFIRSVRLFEDQIDDPALCAQVKDFAAQEAHHSVQHRLVNQFLDDRGYQTQKVDSYFKEKVRNRITSWSPERRLARTVVAEHVTAVMAHYALTNLEAMSHFPHSMRDLFQWHAIEEIEHKSVAFDVYQQCVGDQKRLRREFRYFSYYEFPKNIVLAARYLHRRLEHKSTWRERKELWRYLFGRNGLISSQRAMYMAFLTQGFHPWEQDNSDLVEQWKIKLSPHFISPNSSH